MIHTLQKLSAIRFPLAHFSATHCYNNTTGEAFLFLYTV